MHVCENLTKSNCKGLRIFLPLTEALSVFIAITKKTRGGKVQIRLKHLHYPKLIKQTQIIRTPNATGSPKAIYLIAGRVSYSEDILIVALIIVSEPEQRPVDVPVSIIVSEAVLDDVAITTFSLPYSDDLNLNVR